MALSPPPSASSVSPGTLAASLLSQSSEIRLQILSRLWQATLSHAHDRNNDHDFQRQNQTAGNRSANTPYNPLTEILASVDTMLKPGLTSRPLPSRSLPARSLISHAPQGIGPNFSAIELAALHMPEQLGQEQSLPLAKTNRSWIPILEVAAKRSGVPAKTIAAIINAEAGSRADGSWNTHSKNPRSTATGLGQFINSTWISEAERPGTMLNTHARQAGMLDASGSVRPEKRAALLDLRKDGVMAIHAIADFAALNINTLQKQGLGSQDLQGEDLTRTAYMAHHLGLGDTRRFLSQTISVGRARSLLAAQIGSNRAQRLIAQAGDARMAHREWLNNFMNRKLFST